MSDGIDTRRFPRLLARMFSELASATLRHEYAKDLHNIPMLQAIEEQDFAAFVDAWERRYDRKWHE